MKLYSWPIYVWNEQILVDERTFQFLLKRRIPRHESCYDAVVIPQK